MSRPNPNFQGVKWRFLSEAALSSSNKPANWTEGPKKRIGHLEKALASTHDLEAQYQSFLQEVARSDPAGTIFDGVGPGWVGVRGSYSGDHAGLLEPDIIPSDPVPQSLAAGAAAGRTSAEDAEVARVQASAPTPASAEGVPAAEGGQPSRAESPAPVIIWRHSAPVKIATNVPADLLEEHEQRPARGARAGGGLSGGASSAERAARPMLPPVQPLDPKISAAKSALNRRMAYGVWYLPKEQWESRAFDAGRGALGQQATGGGAASGSPGGGSSGRTSPAANGARRRVGSRLHLPASPSPILSCRAEALRPSPPHGRRRPRGGPARADPEALLLAHVQGVPSLAARYAAAPLPASAAEAHRVRSFASQLPLAGVSPPR